MLKIASAQVWVHDQEIALKYWTEKVGMEVRQDITLPELGFRWLHRRAAPPGRRVDCADGGPRPADHG